MFDKYDVDENGDIVLKPNQKPKNVSNAEQKSQKRQNIAQNVVRLKCLNAQNVAN